MSAHISHHPNWRPWDHNKTATWWFLYGNFRTIHINNFFMHTDRKLRFYKFWPSNTWGRSLQTTSPANQNKQSSSSKNWSLCKSEILDFSSNFSFRGTTPPAVLSSVPLQMIQFQCPPPLLDLGKLQGNIQTFEFTLLIMRRIVSVLTYPNRAWHHMAAAITILWFKISAAPRIFA